jgi:WD repeat-containing protein 19
VTKVDKNLLTLSQGNLFSMTGISVGYVALTSHAFLYNYTFDNDTFEGHTRFFFANLALKRFQQCLVAAKSVKSPQFYEILGRKAMEHLDLDVSIKSYQMGKNLSMVLTLEPLLHENEKDLLVGHVAMILGKYDIAQEYYLKSS